jgi:hypothetical protein
MARTTTFGLNEEVVEILEAAVAQPGNQGEVGGVPGPHSEERTMKEDGMDGGPLPSVNEQERLENEDTELAGTSHVSDNDDVPWTFVEINQISRGCCMIR